MVGDPLQFSAVGCGGMFGLLVDTFGAIELERVHRFDNEWERDASLRLRHGDISVADIYQQHGRLHGGTAIEMERGSVARWWELRSAGKAALLMTPTNEATERLNVRCQHTRVRNGELDTDGVTTTAGAYRLFVGDEIATRHNDRHLLTDRGVTVKNRAVWTIDTISVDGAVTATGKAGTVTLPGEYVTAHVDLAYARTGMGGQGRTVKGGLLYSDGAADLRNLYVPLTRGTETNEAFFATTGEKTALDVFIRSMSTDWIDQPAHTRRDELNNTTPHRPGLLDTSHLRQLVERRFEIAHTLEHAATNLRRAGLDRATAHTVLAAAEQRIIRQTATLDHANDVIARHDRPLHRRNHARDIATAPQRNTPPGPCRTTSPTPTSKSPHSPARSQTPTSPNATPPPSSPSDCNSKAKSTRSTTNSPTTCTPEQGSPASNNPTPSPSCWAAAQPPDKRPAPGTARPGSSHNTKPRSASPAAPDPNHDGTSTTPTATATTGSPKQSPSSAPPRHVKSRSNRPASNRNATNANATRATATRAGPHHERRVTRVTGTRSSWAPEVLPPDIRTPPLTSERCAVKSPE